MFLKIKKRRKKREPLSRREAWVGAFSHGP
jgi:hypothetical protein